jgi:hypothetical protein
MAPAVKLVWVLYFSSVFILVCTLLHSKRFCSYSLVTSAYRFVVSTVL